METPKVHFCFTLSEEQLKYLRHKKYKIDRMDCFMSLVSMTVRESKLIQLSKTQKVEILAGQFMVDHTQLAKLWGKDRKTVPKLLDAMESLGIFSSQKVTENRIYTLHSLTAWYVDGQIVHNPFALKRKQDSSGVFHADVPPARVIIVKDENSTKYEADITQSPPDKSKDGIVGNISLGGGAVSEGMSQSNEEGAVGKSDANGKLSVARTEQSSLQSFVVHNFVVNPSSIEGG